MTRGQQDARTARPDTDGYRAARVDSPRVEVPAGWVEGGREPLSASELRAIKARLTKLEKLYKMQPGYVLGQCDQIVAIFEARGWPDWWARVARLRQDADAYENARW